MVFCSLSLTSFEKSADSFLLFIHILFEIDIEAWLTDLFDFEPQTN